MEIAKKKSSNHPLTLAIEAVLPRQVILLLIKALTVNCATHVNTAWLFVRIATEIHADLCLTAPSRG